MAGHGISPGGRLAIGLAILGSLIALANQALRYRSGDGVDWGHVALALGVPILMYGIVKGASEGAG